MMIISELESDSWKRSCQKKNRYRTREDNNDLLGEERQHWRLRYEERKSGTYSPFVKVSFKLLSRKLFAFVKWEHAKFLGTYSILVSRTHTILFGTSPVFVKSIDTFLSEIHSVTHRITGLSTSYNNWLLSYYTFSVAPTLSTKTSKRELCCEVRRQIHAKKQGLW